MVVFLHWKAVVPDNLAVLSRLKGAFTLITSSPADIRPLASHAHATEYETIRKETKRRASMSRRQASNVERDPAGHDAIKAIEKTNLFLKTFAGTIRLLQQQT